MTAHTLSNVRAVDEILDCDRRCTVRQIAAEVNISSGSAHNILKKDMDLSKRAPKFIPHILTVDQKKLCIDLCRANL